MDTTNKKHNPFMKFMMAVGPQKLVIILVIILLAGLFSALSPAFRQYSTVVSIFDYSYYISFMAIGVTFAIITAGIDLSIGTLMICSSLASGYLVVKMGWPVWLGMIVCILMGTLFGVINGYIIGYLHVPPFITTLGTMMIARGLGSILTGGLSLAWPPSSAKRGAFRSIFKINTDNYLIPSGFILVIILVILMSVFLNKTRPGRYIKAVGSNKEATKLSGVKVEKYECLAYIICGTFAGLAGISYAGTFRAICPGTGAGFELDAIAAVVIGGTSMTGGKGSIVATLLGVFVMSLLKTGLPYIGLQANWQQIITGIILIVAIFIDVIRSRRNK
jgi:ribose transport system permease protein